VFDPGLGWSSFEAQAIYGIYVGMVYFMVIPGGWLADNILGHQKAVLYGAIIIALGHFTLALPLEQTFFLGLIFVVLGTGLLKGNISSIVGKLYKDEDDRRESGYTIFYMAINIGSTLGFLVCSYLGEKIGWHWGFGAAGFGMAFGVIQFVPSSEFGSAPADPNKPLDRTNCMTPKAIPKPAAPKPQCQPIFSPRYEQTKKPSVEPMFIAI
jgi:POT family proton-dependent oligopeptide transporter